jgi:1,4-alpha-glucan branching enzyme
MLDGPGSRRTLERWITNPERLRKKQVLRMRGLESYTVGGPKRYSAKKMSKPVHFYCEAPEANAVSVAGDFNHWNPLANPMQRMPDGRWRAEISLHHGHHQYLFVVDGKSVLDPRAQGISRNPKGERVSLIAVS